MTDRVPPLEPPDAPGPAGGVLVIGYGNSLRGDDGVGPRVAELVAADPRVAGETAADPGPAAEIALSAAGAAADVALSAAGAAADVALSAGGAAAEAAAEVALPAGGAVAEAAAEVALSAAGGAVDVALSAAGRARTDVVLSAGGAAADVALSAGGPAAEAAADPGPAAEAAAEVADSAGGPAADPPRAAVVVLAVHQLTPELALDMRAAGFVVLVDATTEVAPGAVVVRRLDPGGEADATSPTGGASSHHVGPGLLLTLARDLYGAAPEAHVVSVGVADMETGEALSPPVAAAVPAAVDAVARLVAAYREARSG